MYYTSILITFVILAISLIYNFCSSTYYLDNPLFSGQGPRIFLHSALDFFSLWIHFIVALALFVVVGYLVYKYWNSRTSRQQNFITTSKQDVHQYDEVEIVDKGRHSENDQVLLTKKTKKVNQRKKK